MEIRFKLNPNNTKDKKIIDLLESEYSATDVIKGMLYKTATNGMQGNVLSIVGGNTKSNQSYAIRENPQSDKGCHIGEDLKGNDEYQEIDKEMEEFFN